MMQMAQETGQAAKQAPAPETKRIGPLSVRAGSAEVEAFRRETLAAGDGVPFTFPIRWFTHPEIRTAATAMLGSAPFVPLHESQSFDYEGEIALDHDYAMVVEIVREHNPARLILRAEIGNERPCLKSEMILRIIPAAANEAATP